MLKMPFILRALIRDWRSGELTLLTLALIISITCVSALNNLSSLIYHQLSIQAANMLGADLVLTSSLPIPRNWQDEAQKLGLKQTTTLSFLSMVEYGDALQLAQIKSLVSPYPLYGKIKIAQELFGVVSPVDAPPKEGTIWVSPRLLPLLKLPMGGLITIGMERFKVDGILIEEPGQGGDWFNLSPRIIMNQNDIIKTGVIQQGSNITYRWLLAGPSEKLQLLKNTLSPSLTEQQQWSDGSTTNQTVMKAIDRTLIYLHLGTLMSLVLAGVAISMASLRYTQRHRKQVAVLRCFGATQREILVIYIGSVLILGLIASSIGVVLGYAVQPLLVRWLSGLFPRMESLFFLKPALLSLLTGLTVLLSFTLPNLLKLRHITAINLFKPQPRNWNSSAGYSYALIFLAILAYLYTRSWEITLIVVMGCSFYILLSLGLLVLSSTMADSVKQWLPFNWRFGFTNIARNLTNSTLQVIGIGLALTAVLTLVLLKNNLLQDWQAQLPNDAANFFIINIEPNQVDAIDVFLKKQSIKSSALYPMVRGRISTINDRPPQQVLGDKINEINALQRELNFSWTDQIPEGNTVIAGEWDINSPDEWISIEADLAKRLELKVGDKLGIRLGDTFLNETITSIRSVNWINLKPNFFILFKPGLIDKLPKTYIVSFYLPNTQQKILLELVKQFPNITVIDIADTLKKIQDVFASAGKAISLMTVFGLLAGIIIAILSMLSFQDLKQQETFVLKVLGMRKASLLWIRGSESLIIGFFSGLLAISAACAINYYLSEVLLK